MGLLPVAGRGLPTGPLASRGFIEEEYFVSGEVAEGPYRTSMLVRKPADPSAFSGVVMLETLHNLGPVPLSLMHMALSRDGHAWVMVASQQVAMENNVKKSDPTRYASLSIPDIVDGSDDVMFRPDPVSNAILSQVGALLKGNLPDGPFQGCEVTHLLMGGASQTGGTTLRYIR